MPLFASYLLFLCKSASIHGLSYRSTAYRSTTVPTRRPLYFIMSQWSIVIRNISRSSTRVFKKSTFNVPSVHVIQREAIKFHQKNYQNTLRYFGKLGLLITFSVGALSSGSLGSSLAALAVSYPPQSRMTNFTEADKLFDESKYEDLFELLKSDSEWESNPQNLWRLARCEYQLGKKVEASDKSKHSELLNIAYEHVKKSLQLDDKNGLAHKDLDRL